MPGMSEKTDMASYATVWYACIYECQDGKVCCDYLFPELVEKVCSHELALRVTVV